MAKKVLAVFYYGTIHNEEIINRGTKAFYESIENKYKDKLKENGIDLVVRTPRESSILYKQINELTASATYEELYLHFSGHGETTGIYFDKWLLSKVDYANLLKHKKIKFCFFSSCNSEELSQLVFEKKIPIVIGIDGKIGNEYAISIQKKMYAHLIERRTFIDAFNLAVSETNQDKNENKVVETVQRGGGSLERLKEKMKVELKILIKEEEEKNRCLIYPTFLNSIPFFNGERELVLLYCNNSNTAKKFKKEFIKDGLNELNQELFILDDNSLEQLRDAKRNESEAYQLLFSGIKTKIIFLIPKANKIFKENETLKDIFDDSELLDNDIFQFAIIIKNGEDATIPFEGATDFVEITKQKHKYIYYDNKIEELFAKQEFNELFTNININPEERKEYIRNIACSPTKKESGLAEIAYVENDLFRVFFASKENERLIYYIIKLMIHYREIETPILISDSEYSPESSSIEDWIKNAVSRLPFNNKFKNKFKVAEKPYVGIAEDLILVFRTNYSDHTKLSEKINKFLGEVNKFDKEEELKKHLRLLFFINDNSDGFAYAPPSLNKVANIINFSTPDPIDFNKWKKDLFKGKQRSEIKKINELLPKISDEELEKYKTDCPSSLIGTICDKFKIPQKHFLKIS